LTDAASSGSPAADDRDRPGEPGRPISDSPEAYDAIEDALLDLWNVVDDLSRIRPPAKYYRVTIFGSSRMREGDPLYDDVRRLARELASLGCDIVTGGGPGLMQAANEGESLGDTDGNTRSYGLNIDVPHEQEANPFVDKAYMHRTFFSRLHHFVRLSNAFVVVPGGIGTTLEALMIWQLCQVRHVHDLPLVLVGDMWEELVAWAERHMVGDGRRLADDEDLEIPRCVATVDEAVEIVRADREAWLQRSD
jgi:uncharacterized protein (TIGR00730 family)